MALVRHALRVDVGLFELVLVLDCLESGEFGVIAVHVPPGWEMGVGGGEMSHILLGMGVVGGACEMLLTVAELGLGELAVTVGGALELVGVAEVLFEGLEDLRVDDGGVVGDDGAGGAHAASERGVGHAHGRCGERAIEHVFGHFAGEVL